MPYLKLPAIPKQYFSQVYEVPTKVLKQAVRRNSERFPDDFMFELIEYEFSNLRSQFVTSSWGGMRYLPFAFTEQGVAMLSSVLKSDKAIQVNIAIIRAFVAMRNHVLSFAELEQQIAELEANFERELSDVHEVLKWLGEENQARTNEISAIDERNPQDVDWQNRPRIGFKKEPGI